MVDGTMFLSIRNFVNGLLRKIIWNVGKLANTYGLQAYAAIWITAMMLGYYGYYQYYHYGYYNHQFKVLLPWTEILYQTFQLFALKSSIDWSTGIPFIWQLEMARWMALLFTSVTAGMILVLGVFSKKIQSLMLWTISDHVIICGSGRIGSKLIKRFSDENNKYNHIVVIEQNKQNKSLESFMHSGISVVYGDAKDANILKNAGIERAKYLITALGDDNANAEVAIQAKSLVEKRKNGTLTCLVNILDPKLCDFIKIKEFDYINNEKFKLEFFNLYEKGASLIFETYPLLRSKDTNLLIVGLGSMGESLAIQAAKNCWDNYVRTKNRLNITVVDRDAVSKVKSMSLRYPHLETFCNIRYENCDIHASDFLDVTFQHLLSGETPITAIFICVAADKDGFSTALLLHHYLGEKNIPIIVRMNSDEGLASLLKEQNNDNTFSNLHSFGLWDQTCNASIIEGTTSIIAKAIHEEYFEEQKKLGVLEYSKPTMRPWDELDDDTKSSNLNTAHGVTIKIESVLCSFSKLTDWEAPLFEFEPIEIIRLGMMEHDRWCKDRLNAGWKYNKERNDQKKLHPSLVSWAELSVEDKKKDFDNIMKLPSVLSRVDIHIYRKDILELIARAYYNFTQKDAIEKKSWWEAPEKIRTQILKEANIIKNSLDKCDFAITGYIEGESLGEITAEDVDDIAKAYYDMSLEDISHTENNSPRRSWNELSEENRQLCRSKVDFWPEMFIRSKMQMYNVSRLMEIYKMDLKLLEGFYKSSR